MAYPDFPASLGIPEWRGYRAEPYADFAVFSPDAGADIVRRRTGRSGFEHRINFIMDDTQRKAFFDFYNNTINGGASLFRWQNPLDAVNGTKLVVRIAPGSLRVATIGALTVRVEMILMEVGNA